MARPVFVARGRPRIVAAVVGAIAIVASGLVAAQVSMAAPKNLVRDGGFNEGATAWRTSSQNTTLTFPTVSGHGKVAQLASQAADTTVVLNDKVNTVATAQPGERYRVTAKVRAPQPTVTGALRVRTVGSQIVTNQQSFTLKDTAWATVSLTFTVTVEGALDLNVLAWSLPKGRSLQIDDVTMTRISSSESPTYTPPVIVSTTSVPTSPASTPSASPIVTPTVTASPTPTSPTEPVCGVVPSGDTMFGASLRAAEGMPIPDAIVDGENRMGRYDVVRVFESGLPKGWSRYSSLAGRNLIASFKGSPSSILKGEADAELRAWFASAPSDVEVFWTYYHEPEDNIEAGEFTADEYRRAWAHIAGIADEVCRPNLHATLILMGWSTTAASGRTWTDYYPGADVIDVLGWDVYSRATAQVPYSDPTVMFDKVVQISAQEGKPFGIAEVGAELVSGDDGTQRAEWLRGVGAELSTSDAVFVTYFDSTVGGDFRLLDEPSAAAWRSVIAG